MSDNIQPYLNNITDILQRKRINQNITLQDLEKRCHDLGLKISSDTILKIEEGKYIPKTDQLFIILSALGSDIKIDDLNF